MITESKAHSDIGASSLYRYKECPGSVRESKGITSRSSAAADEGTLGHTGGEHMLTKGRFPDDWSSGLFLMEYPDMIDAVMVYVNFVRELIEEDKHPEDLVLIERRFHLIQIHPDAFGTADCVIYKARTRTLHVIDYKHGKGHVVEVKSNPQLYYYGLGAMLSLPEVKPRFVRSVIVQPRAYHENGPIREETYTVMELLDFALDLKRIIQATEDPKAILVPGSWCHFCPAKHKCPKLYEIAVTESKNEFSPIIPHDSAKLAKTLALLPAIEAWVKGIREFAYSEAEAGRVPAGHKLVCKRATRQWADEAKVAQLIERAYMQDTVQKCFTSPELKSVAQVEKAMGKKDFEQLGAHVVSISSGTTLVTDDDKRPAVQLAPEFKKIPSKLDLLS